MQKLPLSSAKSDIEKLEMVFEAANEGFFYMTTDGTTKFYNKNFYSVFDIDPEHNNFENWLKVVHPDDRQFLRDRVAEQFNAEDDAVITEYRTINKKGDIVWIEALGKLMVPDDQHDVAMVGYHSDITARKRKELEIQQLAFFDGQTQLYNRHYVLQALKELLKNQQCGFLIYINANHLKIINTRFGFDSGNTFLSLISERLVQVTSNDIVVARNYADEFLMLVNHASEKEMASLLTRLEDVLSQPYCINDVMLITKACICVYPITDFTDSPEQILQKTEQMASYMVQKQLQGIQYYHTDIAQYYIRQLMIEQRLHWALSQNEIYVQFQPIVQTSTGVIRGFETLLRWKDSDLGIIGPNEFIPIAEHAGVIHALGDFALKKACEFALKLSQFESTYTVSVNLSLIQLLRDDYVDKTLATLDAYGLDFNRIIFEVTESITLDQEDAVLEKLKTLNAKGIRIAIDDFGSGYSSMNAILKLPIAFLKIDKSIVQELLTNQEAITLVELMTTYSHKLDYTVIAEGVETEILRNKLIELHIDGSQGYLFSKPVLEEEALALIHGDAQNV